ncbi:MAG TPA: penicillin-binding transpeptidase domain-containing protein [Kofleriaceae bacterium]|nr:penicillin-binding transpeptidase domain-containing protein [Kofleriaceae bacterium]
MRRAVLLAGGALLAGAGLFIRSGAGPTPKASIDGEPIATAPKPIEADSKATPEEIATYESLGADPIKQASVDLQLDKMELKDGHYEAPLKDGRRATLTLDPDLQKLAEKLLNESRAPRGAIVAMTPDGKILAFAGRRTQENKGGKEGTFDYHLATDVWAPAASVFKLVTASALLSNGFNPDDKVCYHGGVRSVMESNLTDSKSDGNCETLGYGVAHSNNAILGKLAYQKLDPTKLDHQARDLGWTFAPSFGVKATCGELDLPKDKNLDFAKAAAGFNGSRLSVLGGALLSAIFASGGQQPVPRIIESINGKPFAGQKAKRVLPETVAKTVATMMQETCESGSAAKTFRKRSYEVAGKTGTLSTNKPFFMEHSWFVGFAPTDQPQIVISVLLGNPESWHLRGHEAAKRMIDRAIRRAGDREENVETKSTKSSARASKR